MRTFDLTPLFRSTVGFDRLAAMLDAAGRLDDQAFSYPPYNIEKLSDDDYRITMAVAGFGEKDLDVTVKDRSLVVTGKGSHDAQSGQFLHRGVAGRSFERRFELADHIQVKGANLVNGLLHVDLVRVVPEALKPRTIAIGNAAPEKAQDKPKTIETQAAA
ncbi:MAG TPA: Hsp20 family protein [Magnetospirillaceae bacterium]|jgi:molecular chaperone IbpA